MPTAMCIDPGFAESGVVFIDAATNDLQHYTLVSTEKSSKKKNVRSADDFAERSMLMFRELTRLLCQQCPDAVFVEMPTLGAKSASAMRALSLASGIISSFIESTGLPYESVSPTDVKKALCASKTASKTDMCNAAAKLYPQLKKAYYSKRSADGWSGDFEHVADAVGVYMACKNGSIMRLLAAKPRATAKIKHNINNELSL